MMSCIHYVVEKQIGLSERTGVSETTCTLVLCIRTISCLLKTVSNQVTFIDFDSFYFEAKYRRNLRNIR